MTRLVTSNARAYWTPELRRVTQLVLDLFQRLPIGLSAPGIHSVRLSIPYSVLPAHPPLVRIDTTELPHDTCVQVLWRVFLRADLPVDLV